jgi:gluconokinase
MIFVVTGVAGSGKSTIAKTLARKLRIEYVDADDFHSEANINKMRNGEALTDEDRLPWLQAMRSAIEGWIHSGKNVVLACSGLKKAYRDILKVDEQQVRFAYLKGSQRLFASRLARRKDHFMKGNMLASQFATLEEPTASEATICDASQSVQQIVSHIISENKAVISR